MAAWYTFLVLAAAAIALSNGNPVPQSANLHGGLDVNGSPPSTPGASSAAPSTPGASSAAPSTPGAPSDAPSTPGASSDAPSTPAGGTTPNPHHHTHTGAHHTHTGAHHEHHHSGSNSGEGGNNNGATAPGVTGSGPPGSPGATTPNPHIHHHTGTKTVHHHPGNRTVHHHQGPKTVHHHSYHNNHTGSPPSHPGVPDTSSPPSSASLHHHQLPPTVHHNKSSVDKHYHKNPISGPGDLGKINIPGIGSISISKLPPISASLLPPAPGGRGKPTDDHGDLCKTYNEDSGVVDTVMRETRHTVDNILDEIFLSSTGSSHVKDDFLHDLVNGKKGLLYAIFKGKGGNSGGGAGLLGGLLGGGGGSSSSSSSSHKGHKPTLPPGAKHPRTAPPPGLIEGILGPKFSYALDQGVRAILCGAEHAADAGERIVGYYGDRVFEDVNGILHGKVDILPAAVDIFVNFFKQWFVGEGAIASQAGSGAIEGVDKILAGLGLADSRILDYAKTAPKPYKSKKH